MGSFMGMRLSIFFVHELFYLIVEGRNNIRGLVFKKKVERNRYKKGDPKWSPNWNHKIDVCIL